MMILVSPLLSFFDIQMNSLVMTFLAFRRLMLAVSGRVLRFQGWKKATSHWVVFL